MRNDEIPEAIRKLAHARHPVHDELNDRTFEWNPEWADSYREHAIFEGAKVGWDGLILDGWRPLLTVVST